MPATDVAGVNFPFAFGGPAGTGELRTGPQDFLVEEIATFSFTEDGEHDYLFVEKTNENTDRVAGFLARHAGVPRRDVGYAGRKDRNAVTRQWFSVRRPGGNGTDWSDFVHRSVRIVDIRRNRRKLKTGALLGNRFQIRVRNVQVDSACLAARISDVSRSGVPNYFGPQRFGRNGSNIDRARLLFAGKRLRRNDRSLALSAARSFLFNQILAKRVEERTWNKALPGDVFNLDASNAFFGPEPINEEIRRRIRCKDIHPTAVLWGRGDPCTAESMYKLEQRVAGQFESLAQGLVDAGMTVARRTMRTLVHDLEWQLAGGDLSIAFRLAKGAYATSVLREVIRV